MSDELKMAETAPQTELHWYIVHAYSGRENAVLEALRERVHLSNFKERFGEMIVPTEEVVELRGGQKCRSKRKFFPGYVLVQMAMDEETWHLVKSTPWVMGFVGGTSSKPAPVPESEIEDILSRVKEGAERPRPKVVFSPGEVVRIVDGPFAEFDGVVDEVNYAKNRLVVSVLIFGRSTPVELEFSQVQKA